MPEIDLSYLALIAFIGVIAATVQLLEMLLDRFFPAIHSAFGVFLPLLTVQCAILAGSLFMVERSYSLAQSAVFGLGSGTGFAIAVVMLSAIRARLGSAETSRRAAGARHRVHTRRVDVARLRLFHPDGGRAMTEIVLGASVIMLLVVGLSVVLLVLRRRLVPDVGIEVVINEALHLVARRGDKLLGVLHGAEIPIPAACGGSGTCGLCRVEVTGEGAGEAHATERGVLSPQDRRNHVRLACQTSLHGDCAVRVPDDILSAGGGFTCTVASTRMLAPLIREIVLYLPADRPGTFRRAISCGHGTSVQPRFRQTRSAARVPRDVGDLGLDGARGALGRGGHAGLFDGEPPGGRGQGGLQHPPRRAAGRNGGRGSAGHRLVLALFPETRRRGHRVGPVRRVPRPADRP